VVTHSIELLTCEQYGCPGCTFRHFHRSSDDAVLTEVPDQGMFTKAQLGAIGRVAVATGAVDQEPGRTGTAVPGPEEGTADATDAGDIAGGAQAPDAAGAADAGDRSAGAGEPGPATRPVPGA
jgi:hypothetical protein